MTDLVTRAIRFTNTTRPNSADNRKAIQLVRELLQHINELDKQLARAEYIRKQQVALIQKQNGVE
jgi:hypothetical protein